MQLIIRHKISEKLSLPLNYNHILQAVIYHHLQEGGYGRIHDGGVYYDKRTYKLFVFSLIRGKYHVCDRKIIFKEQVEYEIRSPDVGLIRTLAKSIRENGITYGENTYRGIEVEVRDYEVEEEELTIRMLSPVCIYSTDPESGFTYYYSPWEDEFSKRIQDNFCRKYQAYSGVVPNGAVEMAPLYVGEKDKFITKYKGIYMNGWNGQYLLKGPRKYLDFLYQTGVGSKNSQGFGMFQIIH